MLLKRRSAEAEVAGTPGRPGTDGPCSEIADPIFWSLRERVYNGSLGTNQGTNASSPSFTISVNSLSLDRFSSICSQCAAKQSSRTVTQTAFYFLQ